MKDIRFTIGKKILGGFMTLILIFIVYAGITIFTVNQNSNLTATNSNVIKPSVAKIKDFNLMIIRSKMLVTNWVYLRDNNVDKEALKKLHAEEYPALKEDLTSLMDDWIAEEQQSQMDTVFTEFESLIEVQKEVMASLSSFEDYEDAIVQFMSAETIDREVLPQTDSVVSHLDEVLVEKQAESEKYDAEVLDISNKLRNTSIILGVIFIVLGLIGAFWLASSITKPVNYIKDIIVKLGKGILPDNNEKRFGNDEIGEMAEAVGQLVDGLKDTSYFAENIGNGKYDSDYEPLSDEDVLGSALINMRGNLRKVAEEDKKRNWSTEGLAMFGDILRKNNDNITLLSDDIISSLVRYTKSNQGGIFVINREEDDDPFLELMACYAWDKKKYLEQKIYEGEGLTGQAWLEKETIYMTEVPQDYVMITSGLGEANPNSILIVPLKINEEIYGIIEIASFNEFEEHEREFVEKIAENIASTISSVKINERTSKLLEESREMTEQMRSQEEEMRQNMEELQATQEEMERAQREREDKEKIINYTNMMIELDSSFCVNSLNDITSQELGYSYSDLSGTELSKIVDSKDALKALKSALESGKTWSGAIKFKHKNGMVIDSQFSCGPLSTQGSGGSSYLLIGAAIANEEIS